MGTLPYSAIIRPNLRGRRMRYWNVFKTQPLADTIIVRLTCPEFTSLCPLTGQPDFAHIDRGLCS